MKKIFLFLFCALLSAFACGCVNISDRTLPPASSATTAASTAEPPKTVSVATTTSASQTSPTEIPFVTTSETEFTEEYHTFLLSEADKDFLSRCVFVGDSICSGLMHYEILSPQQVAAQGNIAARNIFDFTFKEDGAELSLLPLLVDRKPDYIVFSMGMNDVNITSKQEFAENYRNLLQTTEGFLPNAKLIVLSVTPIDRNSSFTSNENIDDFNKALEEMIGENEKWTYVDITPELKNSANALKTDYSSGDGIHLSPDAYYAILGQLCDAMKIEPEEDEITAE